VFVSLLIVTALELLCCLFDSQLIVVCKHHVYSFKIL